jgi:hypothetical protein
MKYLLAAIFIVFTLFSCKTPVDLSEANNSVMVDTTGLTHAMVLDYHDLDGCTYILVLRNQKKLQPLNLPDTFQGDSIDVYISYKVSGQPSVCMVGTTVTLNKIIGAHGK